MSDLGTVMVGNDFVLTRPRLPVVPVAAKLNLVEESSVPVIPVEAISQLDIVPVTITRANDSRHFSQALDVLHHHSLVVFALLFLVVGASGIEVGANYWSAKNIKPPAATSLKSHAISGLNLTVPNDQLQNKLQTIASQPASLTVGAKTISISPETIKSWLKITPNIAKKEAYIHLNSQAITQSLNSLANKFVAAQVNQVSSTHDGVTQVIVAGHDGASLSDASTLATQVSQAAKSVMNGTGLSFNTPLADQPFQAVTPAAFSKLIEVDVNTHQMYLYDSGNLTKTYAISAGAPVTPTPIGEFHIWEKLTEQTMKGTNPNGTPYVQPNVRWINYFDHSGDAVHGNYWRPASAFGFVNTSHGCVSLPDNEAEEVYNWAPVGTTVITHY